MSLVPSVASGAFELFQGLNAPQQAVVLKSIYDEAKGAIKGVAGYAKSSKKQKKKWKKKEKEQAVSYADIPRASMLRPAQQMNAVVRPSAAIQRDGGSFMAGNAMTFPMRQSYAAKLQKYRVRHKEYVADIAGSVAYTAESFRINPANPVLFPWLSRIAPNFERYQFKDLAFSLKTQTSTTTPGSIMLAIDYDPTDSLPSSKTALLQYEGSIRGAAWDCIDTFADKTQIRRELLTSEYQPADDADRRLSDVGQLIVGSAGQPDASAISELWVDYDLELSVPQAGPMCAEQEVRYSHVGAFVSSVSSGNADIMTDLQPLLGATYCIGVSFTALATGTFDIQLFTFTTGALTANGGLTIAGVASSLDQTLENLAATYGMINALGVDIEEGDAVTIAFNSADEAVLGNIRVRLLKVDPEVVT